MFDSFKKAARPSLDSVTFDTTGCSLRETPDHIRAWSTPEGDGLGIYFFAKTPDLPPCKDIHDLRAYCDAEVRSDGPTIEASTLLVDGCHAIKKIAKVAQAGSGMTYLGSITIPFRDFSFVLKIQCEERGMTGTREAVLLDRQLGAGATPEMIDGRMRIPGFDPDNERFDAEFPTHPLSRARRAITHVATTARVDVAIKKLPSFAGSPE